MNPTTQRILLAMISGYKEGRSVKDLLTDPNFASLPYDDRALIVKAFAHAVGDSVVPKVSALGYAKELSKGAIGGALTALPLSAIIASVATSIFKDGAKDTAVALKHIGQSSQFKSMAGPIAGVGAALGAINSGVAIYNHIKHQNSLADGLKGIRDSATDEEADQAVANMIYSRVLNSTPARGSAVVSAMNPIVREYSKAMTTNLNAMLPYYKGLVAHENALDDSTISAQVIGIRDSDLSADEKVDKLNKIVESIHKSQKQMSNASMAISALDRGEVFDDPSFVNEIRNGLNSGSERMGQHGNAIMRVIGNVRGESQ